METYFDKDFATISYDEDAFKLFKCKKLIANVTNIEAINPDDQGWAVTD